MARPNSKRVVTLNLTDPAYDFVFRFVEIAYPGMPVTAALRELLLVSSGIDPLEAATHEVRRAVRYEVATLLRRKLISNLGDLLTQLQAEDTMDQAMKAAAAEPPPYSPERAA